MQFLFYDRNQYIGAHGAPDLGLHGVFAGAEKVFDAHILLDLCEKQLDLPAAFVKIGNDGGAQHGVVGQKDRRFVLDGVFGPNAPDVFGVIFDRVVALERDPLTGIAPIALSVASE